MFGEFGTVHNTCVGWPYQSLHGCSINTLTAATQMDFDCDTVPVLVQKVDGSSLCKVLGLTKCGHACNIRITN